MQADPQAGTVMFDPLTHAQSDVSSEKGSGPSGDAPLRIAVLGSDGLLESAVICAAASAGHDVIADRVLVDKFVEPQVLSAYASADEFESVYEILLGVDVVIVTATLTMLPSPRYPETVLRAAQQRRISRMVFAVDISSRGSRMRPDSRRAALVHRLRLRLGGPLITTIRDHHHVLEAMLLNSGLNWTVLYTVPPVEGEPLEQWDVVPLRFVRSVPSRVTIPVRNLAATLVEHATRFVSVSRRLVVTAKDSWIPNPMTNSG